MMLEKFETAYIKHHIKDAVQFIIPDVSKVSETFDDFEKPLLNRSMDRQYYMDGKLQVQAKIALDELVNHKNMGIDSIKMTKQALAIDLISRYNKIFVNDCLDRKNVYNAPYRLKNWFQRLLNHFFRFQQRFFIDYDDHKKVENLVITQVLKIKENHPEATKFLIIAPYDIVGALCYSRNFRNELRNDVQEDYGLRKSGHLLSIVGDIDIYTNSHNLLKQEFLICNQGSKLYYNEIDQEINTAEKNASLLLRKSSNYKFIHDGVKVQSVPYTVDRNQFWTYVKKNLKSKLKLKK